MKTESNITVFEACCVPVTNELEFKEMLGSLTTKITDYLIYQDSSLTGEELPIVKPIEETLTKDEKALLYLTVLKSDSSDVHATIEPLLLLIFSKGDLKKLDRISDIVNSLLSSGDCYLFIMAAIYASMIAAVDWK